MAETYYREQVGGATFYPAGSTDPVRANAPFTPVTIVGGGDAPSVPILGVVLVAGVVLWFEFMRRKRRGR